MLALIEHTLLFQTQVYIYIKLTYKIFIYDFLTKNFDNYILVL